MNTTYDKEIQNLKERNLKLEKDVRELKNELRELKEFIMKDTKNSEEDIKKFFHEIVNNLKNWETDKNKNQELKDMLENDIIQSYEYLEKILLKQKKTESGVKISLVFLHLYLFGLFSKKSSIFLCLILQFVSSKYSSCE